MRVAARCSPYLFEHLEELIACPGFFRLSVAEVSLFDVIAQRTHRWEFQFIAGRLLDLLLSGDLVDP